MASATGGDNGRSTVDPFFSASDVQNAGMPIDVFQLEVGHLGVTQTICTEEQVLRHIAAAYGCSRVDTTPELPHDAPRHRPGRTCIPNMRGNTTDSAMSSSCRP